MNVNISNLKSEIFEYKKLIEEYEENHLNLYNEISSASFFWNDEFSKKFFIEKNNEKLKDFNTLQELNTIKNIYDYLIQKYENIGNEIDFNLSEKDNIINIYNEMISKLKRIKTSYSTLNISFCPYEAKIINNQISKIKSSIKNIEESKNKISSIFNKIENIEKEVKFNISKLVIEIIKESYLEEKDLNSTTASVIDEISINNIIEKLKMYRRLESLNYNKIKLSMKNLNINYNTSNTKRLNDITFEIDNKLKIIDKNHNGNIDIISKKLSNYIESSKKTEKIFADIYRKK